mmetsp:Transcript_43888/g.58193  ORF Transcript_43888/g.58193 Transcript_43888/m.58193 type:complete len:133 (+) Transcript_43888:1205-1603(+)
MNPYSTHSSAVKSFNASATKSSAKPIFASGNKASIVAPSAFLTYDVNTTPYKRSRVDSHTFGHEQLFAPLETSAHSKKSAQDALSAQKESREFKLTPLNGANGKKPSIDPILDDDVEEPYATEPGNLRPQGD